MNTLKKHLLYEFRDKLPVYFYSLLLIAIARLMRWMLIETMGWTGDFIDWVNFVLVTVVALAGSGSFLYFLVEPLFSYVAYRAEAKYAAAQVQWNGGLNNAIHAFVRTVKAEKIAVNSEDFARAVRILLNEVQIQLQLRPEYLPCIESKIEGALEASGINTPLKMRVVYSNNTAKIVFRFGENVYERRETSTV